MIFEGQLKQLAYNNPKVNTTNSFTRYIYAMNKIHENSRGSGIVIHGLMFFFKKGILFLLSFNILIPILTSRCLLPEIPRWEHLVTKLSTKIFSKFQMTAIGVSFTNCVYKILTFFWLPLPPPWLHQTYLVILTFR